MSADKVIVFPKVLHVLELDRTVRDDDDDDVVLVVMVLMF